MFIEGNLFQSFLYNVVSSSVLNIKTLKGKNLHSCRKLEKQAALFPTFKVILLGLWRKPEKGRSQEPSSNPVPFITLFHLIYVRERRHSLTLTLAVNTVQNGKWVEDLLLLYT